LRRQIKPELHGKKVAWKLGVSRLAVVLVELALVYLILR
jgi:hypothetical protein